MNTSEIPQSKEEYIMQNSWCACSECKSKGSYVCDGCGNNK